MATGAICAQASPDNPICFACAQRLVTNPELSISADRLRAAEASMADAAYSTMVDTWLDAVFSYGESRRIPVVVARSGANLVAIANLGPGFDVTLFYSRPLVEGRGRTFRRESATEYGERIAKTFERTVIEARKSRMADFTKRPMAAGRA
jgi:hypothetical protein